MNDTVDVSIEPWQALSAIAGSHVWEVLARLGRLEPKAMDGKGRALVLSGRRSANERVFTKTCVHGSI